MLVDGDPAAPGQRHPRGLQAEAAGGRAAAGTQDHHVGLHLAAVIQRHHRRLAGRAGADRGDPGADGNALRGQRLGRQLAHARPALPEPRPARRLALGRAGGRVQAGRQPR
jgi:hypothetical protein